MIPYTRDAYELLHEGSVAFAQLEATGIRVDVDYIHREIHRTTVRVKKMEDRLEDTDVMRAWRKKFGTETNLESDAQLGTVLYDVMGFPPPERSSKSGQYKTDEETITDIDHPFIRPFLRVKKLRKALSTNLKGILRETVDGRIHPFFNLNTTITYRSSSEAINFQNQPVRDKEVMQLIRRAFIPDPGCHLVELDYSGAEVRNSACYNHDPKLIEYITNPAKDMHRDMAMECFLLTLEELGNTKVKPGKDTRYCGKNMFVFPQFYGDWYIDNARALWKAMTTLHLVTADGTPMKDHLASKGIHALGALNPKEPARDGTFEAHIQKVERRFWEKKFAAYAQWKKNWYEAYKKKGWFQTLTGFICQGFMDRKQVINYPVQGSAFHCLLWSVIQVVLRELPKIGMRSRVLAQIHDSMVANVYPEELDDFLRLVHNVMVTKLMKHWDWFVVPMEIEADVAPVDASWADKATVGIPM